MPHKPSQQTKERPLGLVKLFTIISLLLIFAGTTVISGLNIRWARRIQLEKSEAYSQAITENLNHQIFRQFILPIALKYGRTQLRDPEQSERMDAVVKSTLHSFQIDTVNIYDMDHTIAYSYDKEMVGKKNMGGSAYKKGVSGQASSRLEQQGGFWAVMLGIPKKSLLVTFSPLRVEQGLTTTKGPVMGVVEIVQDVTTESRQVFRYQTLILLTSGIVMGILFFALLMVVKRGERMIERRAEERLRLEDQLAKAKHLSSLGEMTAGISHEIRNPLGIIRSSAELLSQKIAVLDPDDTIPMIIVEEATRLDGIITDFLSYARPHKPRLGSCQVTAVIEKNLSFLAPQMEAEDHRVERDVETSLPPVMGDSDLLYQAFLNLLINAMQAMPGGGVTQIHLFRQLADVIIWFDNQGPPIESEKLDKIWDPFFTTKDKGTGLGLGIVKNIIDAHHGRIAIYNLEKGGVRVEIRLPIDLSGDDEIESKPTLVS